MNQLALAVWFLIGIPSGNLSPDCENRSENGNYVAFHFVCKTEDGTNLEDTYESGKPLEMQTGVGLLLSEIDDAINMGVCPQEQIHLQIPSEKYWNWRRKHGGFIEPNGFVLYDMEIVSVSRHATDYSFHWWDEDNDGHLTRNEAAEIVSAMFHPNPAFPTFNTSAMLDIYMEIHDYDNNGAISLQEFMKSSLAADKAKQNFAKNRQNAFKDRQEL